MKKIETTNGYDLYELTKEECSKMWYEYPTIAIFDEGENYENGIEQCSVGTLEEARSWCKEYARNYDYVKTYYVNEDYPAETWEDIRGLTTETARRILTEDEFIRWYKERSERDPDGCYLPLEYWLQQNK